MEVQRKKKLFLREPEEEGRWDLITQKQKRGGGKGRKNRNGVQGEQNGRTAHFRKRIE